MPADLTFVLNLSQSIAALRLVRSATELLSQEVPPLPAGATLSCELFLIDGNGAPFAAHLLAANGPRLLIWVPGPTGGAQLVLLSASAFTAIAADPNNTGWTFTLPLTSQAILNYLAGWTDARPINFEISLNVGGAMKLLFSRSGTLLPRLLAATDSSATSTSIQTLPTITDAATHRALATLGHSLPWVVQTLEADTWTQWTLRARTGSDPDDATIASTDPTGAFYRVPADASPVSNNVLWVRSPAA